MEKEFVPYELAVKLKEIGFNEKCIATIDQTNYVHIKRTKRPIRGAMFYNTIDCPTFSQAFRWFRDKYCKLGCIQKAIDRNRYVYLIDDIVFGFYETYEEAELACLTKLIEIVETRTK